MLVEPVSSGATIRPAVPCARRGAIAPGTVDGDVAELVRTLAAAAVRPAVEYQADAVAGPRVEEQQALDVDAMAVASLTHRHRAHVVVDRRGDLQPGRQHLGDRHVAPPGIDRHEVDPPGAIDEPGGIDADAEHVARHGPRCSEQTGEVAGDVVEHLVGRAADGERPRRVRHQIGLEVGRPDLVPAGSDVYRQHCPCSGVEHHGGRRAADRAGHRLVTVGELLHEAVGDQLVHDVAHRRRTEPRRPGDRRTRRRAAGTQQLQNEAPVVRTHRRRPQAAAFILHVAKLAT